MGFWFLLHNTCTYLTLTSCSLSWSCNCVCRPPKFTNKQRLKLYTSGLELLLKLFLDIIWKIDIEFSPIFVNTFSFRAQRIKQHIASLKLQRGKVLCSALVSFSFCIYSFVSALSSDSVLTAQSQTGIQQKRLFFCHYSKSRNFVYQKCTNLWNGVELCCWFWSIYFP